MYMYNSVLLICFSAYILAVSCSKGLAHRSALCHRIISSKWVPLISAAYVIAKILSIISLFIIVTNVFVMRTGYKNCSSCTVVGLGAIICGAFVLLYYFLFSMAFVFLAHTEKNDR
jgi:hypothetical protein